MSKSVFLTSQGLEFSNRFDEQKRRQFAYWYGENSKQGFQESTHEESAQLVTNSNLTFGGSLLLRSRRVPIRGAINPRVPHEIEFSEFIELTNYNPTDILVKQFQISSELLFSWHEKPIAIDSDESLFPWIEELKAIDAENPLLAQKRVYGYLASHLRDTRDYSTVDCFLRDLDITKWSSRVITAILGVTAVEKNRFPHRPSFYHRAVAELKRIGKYAPDVFDRFE